MKVVIQCAGRKRTGAGRMRGPSGEEIAFVARPDLCPRGRTPSFRHCSPGDPVGHGAGTWRDVLVGYNRAGGNPHGLSTAADLYRPRIYRALVSAFRHEDVFILSAGWGLIRSDFLTPHYDITFSTQKKVPAWARRSKRLAPPLTDLNQLAGAVSSPDEPVHFFGGRDYLPLLRALTMPLGVRVIVHHKGRQPTLACFEYELFAGDRNQNWHYDAAAAFIHTARSR